MSTPNPAENEGAQVTTDSTSHPAQPPENAAQAAGEGAQSAEETLRAADTIPPPAPAREEAAATAETAAASERAPAAEAPAETAAATSEENHQRAYLLQQLKEARGGKLAKGKANRFPRAVLRELNLTPGRANELREQMAEEGYIRVTKKGGSAAYELTDRGAAYLETLEQRPLPGGRRPEEAVTEEVRKYRRTFLLFQLFEAENQTLDQKAINRFREPGRKFLDLKAPAANELREQLAEEGLIEINRQGRNATYRLTSAGRVYLGASAHFPDIEIALPGRVLNDLLEAAREAARQFEGAPSEEPAPQQPEPAPTAQQHEPAHAQ